MFYRICWHKNKGKIIIWKCLLAFVKLGKSVIHNKNYQINSLKPKLES